MRLRNSESCGRQSLWPKLWVWLEGVTLAGCLCASGQSNVPVELSPAAKEYLKHVAGQASSNTNEGAVIGEAITNSDTPKSVTVDVLDNEHKLGLGDKVSFRIEEDKIFEEKNDPVPLYVTDFGELEIPYLGRIPAVGKTCFQLAAEIKTLLEGKYYYHASVLLAVDILNKSRGRIYVAGKIHVPGYVEIPSDEVFTVSKAIMRAGGFSEFADKRHVKVTRKNSKGGAEGDTVIIDVADVLEKGLSGKDLELGPDDRVFVPSKLINF